MTDAGPPVVTVVGVPQSNFTRAIRMACEEKGVAHRLDPAPPHSVEALRCHPLGLIPGLIHGDVVLCESLAIAQYLDAAFTGPRLFPDDPALRAKVALWAGLVSITVDRTMVRDYVFAHTFHRTATGPDMETIASALPVMREQLATLDAAVAATGFLVGSDLTYADLSLMPILAAVRRYPEGKAALEAAPALNAYFDAHARRPSFKATEAPVLAAASAA